MQGGGSSQSVIRLGDLLVDAGYVSTEDMERALDYSRKNFMALGRVLVVQKQCSDEDVREALELQKFCKLDGMSNSVAVRAFRMRRELRLPLSEVLKEMGWQKTDPMTEDPESVKEEKEKLRLLTSTLGQDNRQAAEIMTAIGDLYTEAGLPARAESYYEKALEGFEKASPTSDLSLGLVLVKMSRLLSSQKQYKEARALQDRARAMLEERKLTDSAEYAELLYSMGDLAENQRKYAESEQCFSRCLSVRLGLLPVEDPRVAETIKRVIGVCKKHSGATENVSVGDLLCGAGLVIQSQIKDALKAGKEKGIPLGRALVQLGLVDNDQLQMALQIQVLLRNRELTPPIGHAAIKMAVEKKLGLDEVLTLLGCRVEETGRSKELIDASDSLLKLERELPMGAPELAYAMGRVAVLYYHRQRWTESEQLYERGIKILRRNTNLSEQAAEFLEGYAGLRLAQQDIDGALSLLRSAIVVRIRATTRTSELLAEDLEQLGACECIKGNHVGALSWFARALAMKEKMLGSHRVELAAPLEMQGDCFMHCGNFTKASSTLRRSLTLLEDNGRKDDTSAARVVDKLISSCREMGDRYGAEQLESQYGRAGKGLII